MCVCDGGCNSASVFVYIFIFLHSYCICVQIYMCTYLHIVGHFYVEPVTETNIAAWACEARIHLSNEPSKLLMIIRTYVYL